MQWCLEDALAGARHAQFIAPSFRDVDATG
jgi:hypothetical protein